MRKKIIVLGLALLMGMAFPLCAGAGTDRQDVLITNEEEAIQRAAELFPDLLRGREAELKVSNEFFTWYVSWKKPDVTEGISSFSIGLEPETGWLRSFSYNEIRPKSKLIWITKKQAEKIAYEFACRYQPEKTANTLTDSWEPLANELTMGRGTSPDLRESVFAWRQAVSGIPVDASGICVTVDRSLGAVTSFFYEWKEELPEVSQEQLPDQRTFVNQLIDFLGVYSCYTIPGYDGYDAYEQPLEAKLVYRLNTGHMYYDALSGQPIENYHFQIHKVSREEGRSFAQIPFPEAGLKSDLPKAPANKKITIAQGKKMAAAFFAKLGFKGTTSYSHSLETASRYVFSIKGKNIGHASVELSAQSGEILSYTTPEIVPNQEQEVISKEQAQKIASVFLEAVRSKEGLVQMQPRLGHHGESFQDDFEYIVSWYPLVNGIPFETAAYHVSVSKYGQVLDFNHASPPVSSFEPTAGMMLPEEALISFKNAKPFELIYMDFNYYPSDELIALTFKRSDFCIGAQTGQIIEP